MSTRKPYNCYAGYVASRRSGAVQADGKRGWVVIYRAEEQGIAVEDGGPWAIVCETHGTLLQVTSQRAARSVLRSGSEEFCDCCRGTCSDWCECAAEAVR